MKASFHYCRINVPSKDLARSLIDRDHAVRRCLRTSCHIANVIRTGAPNKLVTLMATQRWLWCCCGRGGRAAGSLTRINIYVLPPPTVRSLQDTPILVGPAKQMTVTESVSESHLNPQWEQTGSFPQRSLQASLSSTSHSMVRSFPW